MAAAKNSPAALTGMDDVDVTAASTRQYGGGWLSDITGLLGNDSFI